jgi:hypothetical protein
MDMMSWLLLCFVCMALGAPLGTGISGISSGESVHHTASQLGFFRGSNFVGGFFAVQYQFAFSSEVLGAAVFAGGPYFCMFLC